MPQAALDEMITVARQLESAGTSEFDSGIEQLVVHQPQGLGEVREALLGLRADFDIASSIDLAVTRALREQSEEIVLETGALLSRLALNPGEDRDDRIEAMSALQSVSETLSRQIGYAATHHPDTEEQVFMLSILIDQHPGVALTRALEIEEQAKGIDLPEGLLTEARAIIKQTEGAAQILHRNTLLAAEALNEGTLLPQARMEKVLDIQETDPVLAAAVLTVLARTGEDTLGQRAQEQKLHLLALDHLSGIDLGLAVAIAPTLPEASTPNSFPNRLLSGFFPLL